MIISKNKHAKQGGFSTMPNRVQGVTNLTNEIALITGAASGIGRLAAQSLSRQGLTIAAVDINLAGLAETAKGHENISTFCCDVTAIDEVESLIATIERDIGPITKVYNAAGIMPTALLLDQPTAIIHKIMAVNYFGLVNIVKATLPRMLARKRGDLIIFASIAGWIPTPYMGAYNASKFAVVTFSEVLYHENRNKGVRMTCVCPPAVNTPLLDQAAAAKPKTLEISPPIEPQTVLDAIDESLAQSKFWCFPGKGTKLNWRLRRFIPELIWKQLHKIEGLA
jgi:short-subunit dehydrogenase